MVYAGRRSKMGYSEVKIDEIKRLSVSEKILIVKPVLKNWDFSRISRIDRSSAGGTK